MLTVFGDSSDWWILIANQKPEIKQSSTEQTNLMEDNNKQKKNLGGISVKYDD